MHKNILKLLETNQIPLLVFFSSLFIFIGFASTRLFISDDAITLTQMHNLIRGSLSFETLKVSMEGVIEGLEGPVLIFGNHVYGKYSYSLIFLSLPFYYILKLTDYLYNAHIFLLQLWALSGGIIAYLIVKNSYLKHAKLAGVISYFILILSNTYFLKPIYFPVWGELLSIEFTNILISSFLVLFVYLFFKNFFSNKIAMFASFFVIFATPISFYAVTLKHHSLSLLLTVLTFYFFYKYQKDKNNRYIYLSYVLAALTVWTRVLDGAVLLLSLLIIDMVICRRSIKYFVSILIIILISLLPFFSFNYLILGSPFSIIELTQSSEESIMIPPSEDFIDLVLEYPENPKPSELLQELGYSWNDVEIRDDWLSILLYITFLKLNNTFGVFLISPFLIISLAFVIYRIKCNIKLNTIDKFFGLYTILLIIPHKNYLMSIITHTPQVFDYRYLLVLYIILLYFALRINKVKDLIENKLKAIIFLYSSMLIIISIYFIKEFPVPFADIYYYTALITSLSLIILLSVSFFVRNKSYVTALLDNLIIFIIALSLSLASFFLLFYYLIFNIGYISPSQNHAILPILDNLIKWMYQMII